MHVRENVTQPADPSYRLIPLTQGQVTKVDADDYEWLSQWKWCAMRVTATGKFYAYRGRGIGMHRQIMEFPEGWVDHRDLDDGLNNRRSNLRNATPQQNKQNRKTGKNNTSGHKGVRLQRGKWIASIKIDGKRVYLGSYRLKEDAIEVWIVKAKAVRGEFYCEG